MADQTEKVLFEIRVDAEQFKQEQKLIRQALADQVLELEKTRQKQKELAAARKAGTVGDEEYAQKSVQLSEQLRAQQADQRELQKGLLTSQKAYQSSAGSVEQLRAQLAEAKTAFYAMSEAERQTAEGQALQQKALAISDALSGIEKSVGTASRDVGKYAEGFRQGLEPLVVELAKIREQQKGLDKDSEAYQKLEQRAIGFQTAAVRAGAQAGLSYEQATAGIKHYTEQIQPAVAGLVKLEAEEKHLAETGQQASESFQKIGFQIQQAKKEIEQVPPVTQQTKEAVGGVNDELDQLGDTAKALPGPLGETAGGLIGGARAAQTMTKAALAFIATPLGLFLALIAGALYAVKTAFTSSEEGQNKYAKLMGVIGALVGNLADLVADLGEKLISVAEDPLAALGTLGTFLQEQLTNRFVGMLELMPSLGRAVGLLFKGQFSEAGRVATDAVGKVTLGVDDLTGKLNRAGQAVKNFAAENLSEAQQAARVADMRAEADKIERGLLTEKAKKEAEIAALRLKARQEDQFSAKVRREALLQAQTLEDGLIDQEKQVLQLRRDAITLENTFSRTNKENLTKEEEAKAAVIRLDAQRLEQQRANQRELNKLNKQLAADAKAAADKAAELALKAQREQLQLDILGINARLKAVQSGSDEELALLQQKLNKEHQLELAVKDLTIGQKKLADAKYEQDSLALGLDFARRRVQLGLQLITDGKQAELTAARDGSAEQLQLQRDLIEQQRRQQLAALDVRENNEAKTRLINAQAAKAQQELEFNDSLRRLDDYLARQRTRLNEQYAAGEITQAQHEAALQAIAKAGQQARITALEDYGRDATAERERQSEQDVQALERELARKEAIAEQEKQIRLAVAATAADAADLVIQAFGEETAAGQAALALKKTAAVAEIAINLAAELSAISKNASANPLNIPTGGLAGISQAAILTAIAVTKAAVSTARVLAFADGGLVVGPGGPKDDRIPAYLSNGEGVMTAKAVQLFGPLLSLMNQLGGGRAFTGLRVPPTSLLQLAAGGGPVGPVRYEAWYMDQMRQPTLAQPAAEIDYARLGEALALRLVPGLADAVVAGCAALPPNQVDLVELAGKQQGLKKAQLNAKI